MSHFPVLVYAILHKLISTVLKFVYVNMNLVEEIHKIISTSNHYVHNHTYAYSTH
jgi:hypothetical protein